MNDSKTAETCDKCGKPFEILIVDFERAMKDDLPILCSDCQTITLNEQMDYPPSVVFKYKVCQAGDTDFDFYGAEGWELVAVDNGTAYFKRGYYQEPP